MKLLLPLFLLFITTLPTLSQSIEKISFGSNEEDYYLAVQPKDLIRGAIVLMPGFGQDAESIFPETKIHNVAYLHGLLVMAVAGKNKLYADEEVTKKLNDAISHANEKYQVGADRFVIGGFSAGGTISLRYAEHCYEKPDEVPISPQAVFSVDSPVDLFAIWEYFERELSKDFSDAGTGEARFVRDIMLREFGDPVDDKENYDQLTPFDTNLEGAGNEKYLQNIAVRVYHDVDVEWLLKERRRSLYDSNALQASEMISRLLLQGNDRAEFMQAEKPGYRSSGDRHPHSWSIVNEVELVQWVQELLEM